MTVRPFSISAFLCLGAALLLWGIYAFTHGYWALVISIVFGWLGVIHALNSIAYLFPKIVARGIHWAHAMTYEVLALACVACSRLARLHPSHQLPAGSAKGRPILLIHGYVNNGSVWIYQKKQLKKAGFGPIYTMDLGYPFHSIVDYAE